MGRRDRCERFILESVKWLHFLGKYSIIVKSNGEQSIYDAIAN